LCHRQRTRTPSAVASPPSATGTTWSSSRKPISSHRRPSSETNEHRIPSRATASRLAARGTYLSTRLAFAARGRLVFPNFLASTLSRSASSARSSTSARSPDGTWCRRSACARTSFAWVSALIVSWSANRSGASGVTLAELSS
jgi:hypothetical protein